MADAAGGDFDRAEMRRRREAKRLTLTALGAAVGVSEATIRRWEDGSAAPGYARGVRLARALGLPDGGLLSPTPERARAS